MRADTAQLASKLRIEERQLEAGGLNPAAARLARTPIGKRPSEPPL
jgi:hypothetical protein